jgi:hypothetical protein
MEADIECNVLGICTEVKVAQKIILDRYNDTKLNSDVLVSGYPIQLADRDDLTRHYSAKLYTSMRKEKDEDELERVVFEGNTVWGIISAPLNTNINVILEDPFLLESIPGYPFTDENQGKLEIVA